MDELGMGWFSSYIGLVKNRNDAIKMTHREQRAQQVALQSNEFL